MGSRGESSDEEGIHSISDIFDQSIEIYEPEWISANVRHDQNYSEMSIMPI
jgi:hypothetical protein